MRSSSGRISIAASAQKLDVDNRISLRYYCRIADNILKQADIFREENNIIDLYVMLLRFSSLVTETIPCHRDYRASLQGTKISLKKKLLNALSELEQLKPAVEKKINELDRKYAYQLNGFGHNHQNSSVNLSLEFSPAKSQSLNSYPATTIPRPVNQEYLYQGPRTRRISYSKPLEEPFRRFSLTIPQANEETLSRHSILGPTGLSGSWQPPIINKRVQYPSNIDFTPVEIPSIQQPVEDGLLSGKDSSSTEHKYEGSRLESIHAPDKNNQILRTEEPVSLISFETIESPPEIKIIRQPSPPPVLAEVQDLVPTTSAAVADGEIVMENPSHAGLVCSEAPLQLHISTALMDSFMRLAKSNTDNNLETCGVLAGSLKNRTFFVTALIIPKQESTSDSCQTTNEEEIFEVQDKQSLFPLGWIHTHPTQSCFMSSIDVHTHYSYQIMLPEAIAIVMAPRDSSRTHGIFRLTTPGGMTVIRQCPRRGFHSHDPPPDGSPIYRQCTDVYMDSNLKFDVVDLR